MKSKEQKVHYLIKVTGKVQGVFYRASTKEVADKLGIKGWVRNEPDGSVLINAEGMSHEMKKFMEWCQQGPQYAIVKHINYEEKPVEGFQDFTVQRQ